MWTDMRQNSLILLFAWSSWSQNVTEMQFCVWMMLAIIYLTFLIIEKKNKKQRDFSRGPANTGDRLDPQPRKIPRAEGQLGRQAAATEPGLWIGPVTGDAACSEGPCWRIESSPLATARESGAAMKTQHSQT